MLTFIHGPVGKVGDGESGPDRRRDLKVFQLLAIDCVCVCSLHTIPALLRAHFFVCFESCVVYVAMYENCV